MSVGTGVISIAIGGFSGTFSESNLKKFFSVLFKVLSNNVTAISVLIAIIAVCITIYKCKVSNDNKELDKANLAEAAGFLKDHDNITKMEVDNNNRKISVSITREADYNNESNENEKIIYLDNVK